MACQSENLLADFYRRMARNYDPEKLVENLMYEEITCDELTEWVTFFNTTVYSGKYSNLLFQHSFSFCSSIVGIIGYILMIIVFYKSPDFQSPSYIYHKGLAWFEIINIGYNAVHRLLVLLPYIWPEFGGHGRRRPNATQADSFEKESTIIMLTLHLIRWDKVYLHLIRNIFSKAADMVTFCVTVDRFIAIYFPSKWWRFNKSRVAHTLLAFSLVFAFLQDFPELFATQMRDGRIIKTEFHTKWYFWAYRHAKTAFGYALALGTTLLTGLIIRGFLRMRKSRLLRQRNSVFHMHTYGAFADPRQSLDMLTASSRRGSTEPRGSLSARTGSHCSSSTGRSERASSFQFHDNSASKTAEWRNLTHLCYLLMALVLPYLLNQTVYLLYHVCRYRYDAIIRSRNTAPLRDYMNGITTWYPLSYTSMVLLDVTNDIYHTSTFYLYLLFSSKFRHNFIRKFCGRGATSSQNHA